MLFVQVVMRDFPFFIYLLLCLLILPRRFEEKLNFMHTTDQIGRNRNVDFVWLG